MTDLIQIPHGRVFTAADLEGMPDDGNRYEIIDGALIVLQPDLLVATREALAGRKMVGLPVLAIEVLSPSTRLIDLNLKKAALAEAGVVHYWVIDPERPSLTAWRLAQGEFTEVGSATGAQVFTVTDPFPVHVSPAALLH
ncbi:Uma2 family endonuclease [Ornithinimicrobium cryptoxanthini]|uniref:Uma2 family endonuclease n=1 Tax=Ornithinimicrobium cryptoxanthini TaxID=2934161 RepID=A0ABY4YES2_9MICO|nr:Uma2 family endonuclease [Ornithinimicrobium cryptoxanthini]USQ75233.1 Uma2 family endonuclease [Ornithinimicrobium cryptoxanthini]